MCTFSGPSLTALTAVVVPARLGDADLVDGAGVVNAAAGGHAAEHLLLLGQVLVDVLAEALHEGLEPGVDLGRGDAVGGEDLVAEERVDRLQLGGDDLRGAKVLVGPF